MESIVFVEIFAIFFMAKLAGELFERLRQPPVVGELLVGIIIANTFIFDMLHLKENMSYFEFLAELGVMILLFSVGLETPLHQLSRVGIVSTMVAVFGVLVPFGLGFAYVLGIKGTYSEAMFIGAAMVATSVGITARVLADLGVTEALESRVILGAAVIDDVLGMIVLTIVSGMAGGERTRLEGGQHVLLETALVIVIAIAFVVGAMLLGGRIVRKLAGGDAPARGRAPAPGSHRDHLAALRQRNAPFVVALVLCFGLSAVARYLGLAAIIGAFVAGMAFAEVRERYHLREKMDPVNDLLAPFFFVHIGLMVHVSDFQPVIGVAVVITILAIVGKLVGCGLAALRLGPGPAVVVGVGMVPRGEVGIIVAMVGLSLHTIPNSMFTVVVFMSIATTLLAPPLLVWAFRRAHPSLPAQRRGGGEAGGGDLRERT